MSDVPSSPPQRGYSALRRHRWSSASVEYFVTLNAQRPTAALLVPELLAALTNQRAQLEQEGHWHVRTWTIMPDHVHVLFELGPSTSLADLLRLFKGRLTPDLRRAGTAWQSGYYEHRMRQGEDCLPVFRYIYLNAVRANLTLDPRTWIGYYCGDEDRVWFAPMSEETIAFPEWLN